MQSRLLCNILQYGKFLTNVRELSYINHFDALLACFSN